MNTLHHKYLMQAQSLKSVNSSGEHSVCWQAPSNIALVKYWGKYGVQMPANPSVSFSLKNSLTETQIVYSKSEGFQFRYLFEDQENKQFSDRIEQYLLQLVDFLPFITQLKFEIRSRNTFPHSSGIASSASSIAALALGLCSIENELFGTIRDETEFFEKASFLARLGSGSACRSVYGGAVVWGASEQVEASSNEFALPLIDLHSAFKDYRDAILIIDSSPKKTSSSAGHSLMKMHPYASARFAQANHNFIQMLEALRNGDESAFHQLLEHEALSLHAMMLTSKPGYVLWHPNTIRAIQKIIDFRNETSLPIGFTLDAGPNVHLLYSNRHKSQIMSFIQSDLLQICENGRWIDDEIGFGPQKM